MALLHRQKTRPAQVQHRLKQIEIGALTSVFLTYDTAIMQGVEWNAGISHRLKWRRQCVTGK